MIFPVYLYYLIIILYYILPMIFVENPHQKNNPKLAHLSLPGNAHAGAPLPFASLEGANLRSQTGHLVLRNG